MANVSPDLLQFALRTLLQGREPIAPATAPSVQSPQVSAPAPSGGFTPPGGFIPMPPGPPPEPAPIAPSPPLDTALIEQLAGPEPQAPVVEPASLIIRIARALQGFGAGTQGQGPQFLANLQEQRERPQREFRAATESYQQRRAAGVEFAERRRAQQQEQTQRRADEQSEREFRQWVARTGVQDQVALEQLRQTFELERDARKAEADRRETERRDRVQQEREARQIENQYFGLSKNRALSVELGRYWAGLKDTLSPAAAKLDARLQQVGDVKMRRAMGSGSGSGQGVGKAALRAAQEVESAKGQLIELARRGGGTEREQQAVRTRIDKALGALRRFPGQVEGGVDANGWPWVKLTTAQGSAALPGFGAEGAPAPAQQPQEQMYFDLRGGAPSVGPQGQTKTITYAQIRAAAAEAGIPFEEAVQQFKSAGYAIAATNE